MQRYGGVVILMQISLNREILNRVTYLSGNAGIAAVLPSIPAMIPFNDRIINFLNEVSRALMSDREAKAYSDVVTFGFWIRKSSLLGLKEKFDNNDDALHMGKGVAFHIAPSNVPVNFAYSLVAGLLTGNANIVRVPSKEFPQVNILVRAFNKVLADYVDIMPYILLVSYGRDKEINDVFSSIADMRIVWGGDATITDLRKSALPPRSGEVTFADRYSFAVIDSDCYMKIKDKEKVADNFYNDTYFTDQNACTSPRVVIWTGEQINEAKTNFWSTLHRLVEKKYTFQPIQGVNKLTSSYLISAVLPGCKIVPHQDNLIIRVCVPEITGALMDYKDNSGYFFEHDCTDILDIIGLCNDKRCQTIAYIGDKNMILPLIQAGVKGIDRIVPMGKTMNFDLIWDGYNLPALLTRAVVLA